MNRLSWSRTQWTVYRESDLKKPFIVNQTSGNRLSTP